MGRLGGSPYISCLGRLIAPHQIPLVITAANYPARIIATDKTSGKLVWETNMVFGQPELRLTSAPLAIKDKIIVGAAGGDRGVRDWIAGLHLSSDSY